MNHAMAVAICLAAALLEGLCAGRDPLARLRALRQPRWSPPPCLWVLIGLFWYGICLAALVRLLPFWPQARAPVLLLGLLLLVNAAVNVLQFRLSRLDLTFFSLFPYCSCSPPSSAWPVRSMRWSARCSAPTPPTSPMPPSGSIGCGGSIRHSGEAVIAAGAESGQHDCDADGGFPGRG